MSKNRFGSGGGDTPEQPIGTEPVAVETTVASAANYTLTFKRNHPQDRCSYGIAGNPGIVVFQRGLFVGAQPFTSNTDLGGLPNTITLSCEMVQPKADNKTAKAEAAAVKAVEKAAKAEAKIVAAQAKAAEKAAKATAALAAAQVKIAAAQAAAAAKVS
jgi:hypothetical protein